MLTSRLLILNQKEAECKEMAAYFQDRNSFQGKEQTRFTDF